MKKEMNIVWVEIGNDKIPNRDVLVYCSVDPTSIPRIEHYRKGEFIPKYYTHYAIIK